MNDLDALFEEEASEEELLNAQMMEMNGNTVEYTVEHVLCYLDR